MAAGTRNHQITMMTRGNHTVDSATMDEQSNQNGKKAATHPSILKKKSLLDDRKTSRVSS
jgi:hypothetical protein